VADGRVADGLPLDIHQRDGTRDGAALDGLFEALGDGGFQRGERGANETGVNGRWNGFDSRTERGCALAPGRGQEAEEYEKQDALKTTWGGEERRRNKAARL